jgi:threonine aldolase
MAEGNDITLPYLARHCDVFYIGGTKIGALCGEAVVFTNRRAHKHFFSIQKQHGAVIAKGALIGLQFEALFTDDLYFNLSRHAIEMAMKMKAIFQQKGVEFFIDSPTNQQFVILPDAVVEELSKTIEFTHWGQAPGHRTICRFVTSWATTEEELEVMEKTLNDAH